MTAATYFDHNAQRGQRRDVSFEVIEWDAPLEVAETRDEDAVRRAREAWERRVREEVK